MGIEETEEKEEEEEKPRKSKMKKIAIKSNSDKEPEPLRKKKEAAEEESWFQPEGELAVDVYETDEDIIIQSTVAGVKPEDLDISIEDDVVTISGERSNEIEDEGKNYFYQECFWGTFSRQIILPQEVDANRAEAAMKDGVFTLRIPKLERQKVKKIKVRV
ncbi:MAG: Hsp20/alpha crystallin family protein [Candidatus Wildermuthbacteria bacterium]|nr:Hsp20/alpha crystallin family protein [Candidatus Wildermuthbacteria bacterium]